MKKILLGFAALLMFFPYLNTRAAEPNINYYQTRYQIACQNHDTTDARCFWNKVEFIHAKESLKRSDIKDYLTEAELGRINKKIGFLETRYENFCENDEEQSYFCPALGKLVEKGQFFLENTQEHTEDEESSYEGDGFESAIVVPDMDAFSGVTWEYDWLEENSCKSNTGYKTTLNQALSSNDDNNYDILTVLCNDGTELEYYFYIDNFFGNFETINEEDAINETIKAICSADIYNCSDYSSQGDAQSVFDLCMNYNGLDIHKLDGDGNGVACESLY